MGQQIQRAFFGIRFYSLACFGFLLAYQSFMSLYVFPLDNMMFLLCF